MVTKFKKLYRSHNKHSKGTSLISDALGNIIIGCINDPVVGATKLSAIIRISYIMGVRSF